MRETSALALPIVVSNNDGKRNFAELCIHTNSSNFKRPIIYPNRWLGIEKDLEIFREEAKHAYVEANTRLNKKIWL